MRQQQYQPPARPGTGTRLISTPFGFAYQGIVAKNYWPHPFLPSLAGAGLTFTRGLVSFIEPVIGDAKTGVPISGLVNGVQQAQPVLTLDPKVVAAGDNRSWACVEITLDSKGVISPQSACVMVHRQTWFLQDPLGKTGRCPVCMILWNGQTPAQVFPILYFNPVATVAVIGQSGTAAGVKQFFFL